VSIRNTLSTGSALVHGFHARPIDVDKPPPIEVPAGETRETKFTLTAAGTYFYWADTTREPMATRQGIDSQLTGALIVDPPGGSPEDRVFVIGRWGTPQLPGDPRHRLVLVANGKTFPYNERLTYEVGKEVHWRWINPSNALHPMHLHGFYFRVDSNGNQVKDKIFTPQEQRMVVTEKLPTGNTFTATWVPHTAGRWLVHCHVTMHIGSGLGLEPEPEDRPHRYSGPVKLGDDTGMKGLVFGLTTVNPPSGAGAAPAAPAIDWTKARKLKLLVRERPESAGTRATLTQIPRAMVFQLQEGETPPPREEATVPGSLIVLTRDEPVEISIVNQLKGPTAVHWHGIELESYFDGVAKWGGLGTNVTPPVEPGATFVARMAPRSAGTFIYHTHWHDRTQLVAGLYGPLLVLEPGEKYDPETDKIFLISRGGSDGLMNRLILLNGSAQPQPQTFKAGTRYRLRFINITDDISQAEVSLLADGKPIVFKAISKDGAALPPHQMTMQPARFFIGVGETYDYEFTPDRAMDLRLEVVEKRGYVSAKIQVK
jgi:FtsP/CotA-like multicopper oxidase with cupredoxin domain